MVMILVRKSSYKDKFGGLGDESLCHVKLLPIKI